MGWFKDGLDTLENGGKTIVKTVVEDPIEHVITFQGQVYKQLAGNFRQAFNAANPFGGFLIPMIVVGGAIVLIVIIR